MANSELTPDLPDEFDRRADQAMWTTQYEREGQYPKPDVSTQESMPQHRKAIPVRGSIQLQIADNDRKAEDIHQRAAEESRLRSEVTEEEKLMGAEQARQWLEKHE